MIEPMARITLNHPWRLNLAVLLPICVAGVGYASGLYVSLLRISAEVHAQELIAGGAIQLDQAALLLDKAGMPFKPDDPKVTGLGAFVVRREHLASISNMLCPFAGLRECYTYRMTA